jgi:glycosyltransferase involved in cell wall biosynthesis
MSGAPELTVVLPVLDGTESVTRAIGTVIPQSAAISVIVVDDGSAADNAAALDELATDGSRVRVVHQPNQGPAAARNAGLRLTNSRYVMFLDSDDELAENAFAAIDAGLQQRDVGLVCGAVEVVSPDGTVRIDYPAVMPGAPWTKLTCLSGSFAVRTDLAHAIGGYDEALRFGENTDFVLRLAEECRRRSLRVAVTNEVFSRYYAASDERRYDAKRLDAALHLLRRGRFDLHSPGERARLHAIASVNAARVRRYGLSARQSALALFAEPRNTRHLARLALALSGPLARRIWLRS